MNIVSHDDQNIFEVIIREALRDPAAKTVPRIYVRRYTIPEKDFRELLTGPNQESQPLILTFLSGDHPVIDIASRFFLTSNWTPSEESESVELAFDRYSSLPCDKQTKVEFAFTEPVIAGVEQVFYAVCHRGFLSAQGFICVFSGTSADPKEHRIIPIWQS